MAAVKINGKVGSEGESDLDLDDIDDDDDEDQSLSASPRVEQTKTSRPNSPTSKDSPPAKRLKDDKPEGNNTHPSAIPTAFRPGRLTNIEILERIFPFQKRTVLELVLQGCNGDLVKAIEHFLSAQDTLLAQQQINLGGLPAGPAARSGAPTENSFHPYLTAFSPFRQPPSGLNGSSKSPLGGGIKSAFTPLSPSNSASGLGGLHSAFTPRSGAFSTDSLLGRHMGLTSHAGRSPADHPLSPPTHPLANVSYPGFNPFHPAALQAGFSPSLFMGAYRPFGLDLSPGDRHTAEKSSDKSALTDSEQASDGWADSPTREHKDSDWKLHLADIEHWIISNFIDW